MRSQFLRLASTALAVLALVATGTVLANAQSDHSQDVQRIQRAIEIFRTAFEAPGSQIPKQILQTGQCVMIIPGYKNLAFGIGGAYGKGIAMCRNTPTPAVPPSAATSAATTPPHARGLPLPPGSPLPTPATGIAGWSAPIFVTIGGASLGAQIGVESSDLLVIYQHREGIESMLNNKVRLGVSAAAAAGPIGRRVEAATDAAMRAQVVAYARSRGIFAGVNINGAIVQPDETGNHALYPHQYWQDVLAGKIRPRGEAATLVAELDHSPYTNPALRPPNAAATATAGAMGRQSTMNIGPGLQAPMPFSVGFAWEHVTSPIGLGGWDLRLGMRPLPHRVPELSVVADIGRAAGSTSLLATSVKSTEWTYLFGPELDMPHRVFDPYANVLLGYAHLAQQTSSVGATTSAGFSTFAWEFGAGVKLNVTRWASIRLLEVDYLHTPFDNTGASHARVTIGGTFNF
ncbi:MAG: YSC84-related protein [Terriglobales bacterium]